jgi:RNA polymerase sigma-70 factor (ECF subfamily)
MSLNSTDGGHRFGVQVVRSLSLVETRRGKKTFLQPKIFLPLRYNEEKKSKRTVKIIKKEQFLKLVKEYEKLIFTICLSFTKNFFDAEDLAQETFLSAYKNIKKFDGTNFKAWLTTIAANKCRDYLKSPARKVADLSPEDMEAIEDNNDLPETVVINTDSENRIWELCNKLREPYRTVSINYFCKNLKLSDVAKNTGENLKTLQTRLTRSKKMLKELWEEEFM